MDITKCRRNCLRRHWFEMDNIGCRFITVDAYKDALDFYLKNNFNFFLPCDVLSGLGRSGIFRYLY
jgi:hypothetical protein